MKIKLSETEVRLDVSFVLVSTLMLIFCEEKIVLISVFSAMLHECGHLVMMYLCKEKPQKVVFGAFGVRIEKYAFSGVSYTKEILIAFGGIIVNLALFAVSLLIYGFTQNIFALYAGIINVFIAIMNMIPVKALDLGRAINCFLLMRKSEDRAEKISDIISLIFCIVFLVFTVFYCICVKVNISLIAVCIYLCLSCF